MFVNRQAMGDPADPDNYNRTYAFDGRLSIGQDAFVQGFVAQTDSPHLGREHAYNLGFNYSAEAWRLAGGFMESGDNFNPEVGFTRRVGFRKVDVGIYNTWRPDGLWKFQEVTPHVTFNRFWNFDGFMETSFLHAHSPWEFEDSSSVSVAYNVRHEGILESFAVSGIKVPAGEYGWQEAEVSYRTNRSAPVSLGVNYTAAGFFGGEIYEFRPSINGRYGETLSLSLSWSRNDINLPLGEVVTHLASTRVAYNFSPRLFVQSLLQYNDSADLWSVNMRFGWLHDANTGLFLVYNETEGIGGVAPDGAGRNLIIKHSHLFDLID